MLFEDFQESLNEKKAKPGQISTKDWQRMLDLVTAGKDGEDVANKLKDKDKAIARFVSGLKLKAAELKYDDKWKEYRGPFDDFGKKALELGATVEEIQKMFDAAIIPIAIAEKLHGSKGKKLDNRFVGNLSKMIIKAGFDIEFEKTNGNAITNDGMDAMQRNGRKWTIGYKTKVSANGEIYDLDFDAITDEGDGPTKYVLSHGSHRIFRDEMEFNGVMRVKAFEAGIKKALSTVSESTVVEKQEFDEDNLDDNDLSLGSIIKNVKDLKTGTDYCVADLGMNSWMGALTYKGKKGGTHQFVSSIQFDDTEIDFSDAELKSAVKDGEIANCE